MKNAFGQFSDDSMDAFNEAIMNRFDFKQCQRTDGTIYGVPDKSSCTQKGAKEVSKGKKKGFGGFTVGNGTLDTVLELVADPKDSVAETKANANKRVNERVSELIKGAQEADLRNALQNIKRNVGQIERRSELYEKSPEIRKATLEGLGDATRLMYNEMVKRQKEEGLKPESLTSMIPAQDLKKMGLSPTGEKLNVKPASKPASKPKTETKAKAEAKAKSEKFANSLSGKSVDELASIAQRIQRDMKAGKKISVEESAAVKAALNSAVAARKKYGNLGDTNNQAAHSANAQRMMTNKEANSFYAGNPSICSGGSKQYYKTVCRKVFSQF